MYKSVVFGILENLLFVAYSVEVEPKDFPKVYEMLYSSITIRPIFLATDLKVEQIFKLSYRYRERISSKSVPTSYHPIITSKQ